MPPRATADGVFASRRDMLKLAAFLGVSLMAPAARAAVAAAATDAAAPPSSPHRDRDRSRNLDVLRAVAALMVLVGHSSHLSGEVVPFVSKDVGEVGLNVLISGVWLFFPISGYVIGRSFVRALAEGRPVVGRAGGVGRIGRGRGGSACVLAWSPEAPQWFPCRTDRPTRCTPARCRASMAFTTVS